ncbi:transcription factor EMB1444-like [Rutidosis leptorrhynchoides]|uniref:transcription factor EMB1444-like n=1 Tax=Rutidosis leptorrhynchoides TaxID=125765 RepID=UPI003A99AFC0
MGTTTLRGFLQSLCDSSCWNYAVFWKLQQHNQMVLTWEDGYVGTSKADDSVENLLVEPSFGGIEETSSCNIYNRALGGDAVELAVAFMSTFQYALGDGVIGDVAYTGYCRWLFADLKSLGEFETSVSEHADEWLIQFAAGVKTILLVPVIPHGVLQLGSMESFPEDVQMANYIKDEFFAHQDFMTYSDAFAMSHQITSQSSLSSMNNLDEFPSFTVNGNTTDVSTTINNDNVNCLNHEALTKSFITPTFDNWYSSHLTAAQMGAIELPEPLHQVTNSISYDVIESEDCTLLNFPKECELHKALGPAFMGNTDDSLKHLSVDESSSSETNAVAKVDLGENNNTNNTQTSSASSLSSSFGQFNALAKQKDVNEKSGVEGDNSFLSNSIASAVFSRVNNHNDSSSPSGISYEGVVDELTIEGEQKSWYDVLHQSKDSKPIAASKRRGKPVAKHKPRPRDRQLIQDRLKDLRELVPDGAKFSIDGLLDRTVKHMQFLESVSDRAIKLRQCVQTEKVGNSPKNSRITEEKSSQQGASWAFELGSDLKVCPIRVEDLQIPGHMIIEMICDESMRFLEIAEVIHGLNLTISNGLMEERSGNTWARYIVEAPKGFHRLDIFWPLMKLLQQQHSPICSKI